MAERLRILILGLVLLLAGCNSTDSNEESASPGSGEDPSCTTVTVYTDADGDGLGDPMSPLAICEGDAVPPGHVADNSDCNDNSAGNCSDADDTPTPTTVIRVTNATELQSAFDSASPGAVIEVAPGRYDGEFHIRASGQPGRPITISGPPDRSAILDGHFSISDWQGVLTIESRHHLVVENLEIRNAAAKGYGVLVGAASKAADGCQTIELRNLHVHDVGEEIIKIQGRNTQDILVENCIVHTNQDWSAIDVQGHWGGTPPYDQKPRRVVIRDNLIYDSVAFAGVGNEFADNIQVYNNVILGCRMGLDIGCGNYNLVSNNLITSYAHFNRLKADAAYTAIDLSPFPVFSQARIAGLRTPVAMDGIALSGNYMTLVYDNEIVDCKGNGDLILSYEHRISDGVAHNSRYGHGNNLFFRNRIHDNEAYYTIREYDKQAGGISYGQLYFNNIFYNNHSVRNIIFEHSEALLFFNNTIVDGDDLNLRESSIHATVKNNIFVNSGLHRSPDSIDGDIGPNHSGFDTRLFAGYSDDDYHLSSVNGTAAIDTGEDLRNVLAPLFETYMARYAAEYAFHDDPRKAFAFLKDMDGETQDSLWDMGAFAVPR